MSSKAVRAAISSIAVAVAVALALPAGALAIPAITAITSPAGGSFLFAEEGGTLAIKGTASGTSDVDIRCYFGNSALSAYPVAEGVAVVGGTFEATGALGGIAFFPEVCQLRAVPHESEIAELGPGQESAAFAGPLLAPSGYIQTPTHFRASSTTFTGSLYFESSGKYSFEGSLYSATEHESEHAFFGDGQLRAYPPGTATRSAVQVDGASAYTPEDAAEVETKIAAKLPGGPHVTVTTHAWSESTHQFSTVAEEPLVRCSPSNAYPPTHESCTSFVPVGVKLLRAWQASHESRLAMMTQAWQSTDGAAHTVEARTFNEMHSGTEAVKEGGVYRFPGEAGFAPTKEKETKTLPAGGMILYKTSAAVPAAGDGAHVQAAIAYDQAPSGPLEVTTGSGAGPENTFEVPFHASIPAGGTSSQLRMTFVQSFSLGEAQALAEAALASYHPTVAITSPANGSSLVSSNPTVTVTGTTGDQVAVSSLTVNGKAVALGAGGAWSTPLTLSRGANTITAVATNQSGLTSTAVVGVNYAAPPPAPAPASARISGSPSGKNGKITLVLTCTGVAGQSCKIALSASAVEHLSHGRLRSISSRNRRVTVASTTVTLAAGHRTTVSLALNRTGRKLLARFGRLPLTLKATLLAATGKSTTLFSARLTVRPKPKPRHHHHH